MAAHPLETYAMSELKTAATEGPVETIQYREGYLETRGVKLFFKMTGNGPPLLILHGGPGASLDYLWEPLLPLANVRTLIFFDQRGCGRSGKNAIGTSYTWDSMVEDVEFVRQSLRLGRLDILGHSFGGLLAQSYAVAYPGNVRSLLLVATASSIRSVNADLKRVKESAAPETRLRLEALETLGIYGPDGAQRPEYRRLADEALMPYIYIDKAPSPTFPSHDYAWDVMRDIWGSESEFECSGDARDLDLVPQLRTLSIPAIVIYGDHDIVSDATARETKAALKGSTVVRVAGAAHEVYVDQPEKFLEAAQAFLSQSF